MQIEKSHLFEQIHKALWEKIRGGEIVPGQRLKDIEWAQRLGVSRTPVREALGRLASEGFAERIPHRGFRIPAESIDELLELYPIVAALEVLAGREALPSVTGEDLQRLWQIQHHFEEAVARDDPRAGIEANRQFHFLLLARSGNRKLAELLEDLRSQVVRLELWSFAHINQRVDSVAQHSEILHAIARSDFPRALEMLEQNRMMVYDEFSQHGAQQASRPLGTSRLAQTVGG
jgi:DNA-binding GntR family transcriptional regulator